MDGLLSNLVSLIASHLKDSERKTWDNSQITKQRPSGPKGETCKEGHGDDGDVAGVSCRHFNPEIGLLQINSLVHLLLNQTSTI